MHSEVASAQTLSLGAYQLTLHLPALLKVQNTLDFFHRSSHHADLPHRLTKNLASMQYHMDAHDADRHRKPGKPSPRIQHSRIGFLTEKQANHAAEIERMQAWDGFADLVGMAEGSAGLLLGKVRPKPDLEE